MAKVVTSNAMMMCTFGAAPSTLTVLPVSPAKSGGQPVATVMDKLPMVNIKPFGVCSSMANPTVASATAAALGVLTPMPCIPNIPGPWVPGSQVLKVNGQSALLDNCKAICAYGGQISITMPGQFFADAKF